MAYERLASLVNEPGGERLAEEWMAVILKALLVHGASWADAAEVIGQAAPPNLDRRTMTAIKRKLLGYGEVEPTRSLAGTEKRVLLLGWDRISADEGHEYLLPLPPALASVRYKRRLTVTLGWISPVNLRHRAYRKAALFLDLPAPRLREALGLGTAEVDRNDSARGTIQHMVFEGDDAIPFVDGAELMLKVNCRADAGKLETPFDMPLPSRSKLLIPSRLTSTRKSCSESGHVPACRQQATDGTGGLYHCPSSGLRCAATPLSTF
jgi:hypothetical protein